MVTTSEIAPSPQLAPFVRCYAYWEFDTNGRDMVKPMHAAHEMTMVFFFMDRPVNLVDRRTGRIVKTGTYCDITGLSTHYLGMATFNGIYSFFEICFRPNGFNRLFEIPTNGITNKIISAEDIFGIEVSYLFERLCAAKTLNERALLADAFLLDISKKRKPLNGRDAIAFSSGMILKTSDPMTVAKLASYANMGVRSFERHFLEEVGMSPRLFCCVARFNHAFDIKLRSPLRGWASIAHECGYYDQAHLIKDFNRFTGNAPGTFLELTPHAGQKFIGHEH